MTLDRAYEILGLNSDASRDDAKKAYRELVKVYHPDRNTAANAAVMFRLIQDAWNCIQDAPEKEITYHRNDAEFYNNQGIAKFELGEYVAAISDFDMALRLDSDDVETCIAYKYRGIAKSKLGEYVAAISDFDMALRLNPNDTGAYIYRAFAKRDLGEHFSAIPDYDSAIRLTPDDAKLYNLRGNAKADLGEHFSAISDYDSAIRLTPNDAKLYNLRGNAKAILRQHIEAISDFDEAILLDPTDAGSYYSRALAKGMLGFFQEERQDILIALELAEQAGDVELMTEIKRDLYLSNQQGREYGGRR